MQPPCYCVHRVGNHGNGIESVRRETSAGWRKGGGVSQIIQDGSKHCLCTDMDYDRMSRLSFFFLSLKLIPADTNDAAVTDAARLRLAALCLCDP